MSEELFAITVVLTERQLRHLRQACADYATARYEARIAMRGDAGATRTPGEKAADHVEKTVFKACELKFPMGKEPA